MFHRFSIFAHKILGLSYDFLGFLGSCEHVETLLSIWGPPPSKRRRASCIQSVARPCASDPEDLVLGRLMRITYTYGKKSMACLLACFLESLLYNT